MLPSSHGASTLGKNLRQPLMTAMSSFEGTSSLANDAVRSTMSRIRGGRAVSTATRSTMNLPQQKTWHPYHGIIFSGTASGTPRSLSTVSVDIEGDLLLHSVAEDNYVMASTVTTALEGQPHPDPGLPGLAAAKVKPILKETTPERHMETSEQDEVPEPCSTYTMPESLFRAAKSARTGDPSSFWSHTLYRGPNDKKPTIHYCKTLHTSERALQSYFLDQKVIGFDIEWAPDYVKNATKSVRRSISLIQIASEDRIALFHIAQYPKKDNETVEDLVAPSLRRIMEDPKVTKLGVAIKADCTRVRKNLGIISQGLFELSHLYKLVKFSESKDVHLINKKLVSLATQVEEHLHLPLYKGDTVRGSDWSFALSMEQIGYAASDAYAAVQLYYTLDARRKRLDPMPPLPWHAELDRPIRLAEGLEIPTDGEEDDPEEVSKALRRKYSRPPNGDKVAITGAANEVPEPKEEVNLSQRPHARAAKDQFLIPEIDIEVTDLDQDLNGASTAEVPNPPRNGGWRGFGYFTSRVRSTV